MSVTKTPGARLPQIVALLAAGVFALMFFITVAPRIVYRYDLDFDEDSILMQSLRVAGVRRIVMVTGDRAEAAETIGAATGGRPITSSARCWPAMVLSGAARKFDI